MNRKVAPVQQKGGGALAKLTPVRAIRKKCLDCCCGQIKEVRLCTVKDCALYRYRNGHRPKDDETPTEESS